MSDGVARVDALQARLVSWAAADANVRALMVFGSLASSERPPDEWTDLDVVLVARRPERLRHPHEWLTPVGRPLLACTGHVERTEQLLWRVLFADGSDLDVSVVRASALRAILWYLTAEARAPRLARLVAEHGLARLRRNAHVFVDTFAPGHRFLLDKDRFAAPVGRALRIADRRTPTERPPTGEELTHLVGAFWQHALRAAKYLARGNVYAACERVNSVLQVPLLTMVQWHSGATQGWTHAFAHWRRSIDPRAAAVALERAADPRVVAGLQRAFARYDAADVRRALLAAAELFALLTRETAAALGHEYPEEGAAHALERLRAACRETAGRVNASAAADVAPGTTHGAATRVVEHYPGGRV